MRVQDVMTRHVETIDRQENAQVAFDSMKLKGIRHLVVRNGSELVGVLYPFFGLLLSPVIASAAMTLSSVSVISNALRLRRVAL